MIYLHAPYTPSVCACESRHKFDRRAPSSAQFGHVTRDFLSLRQGLVLFLNRIVGQTKHNSRRGAILMEIIEIQK
jgi:hypothetical protein